MTEQRKSIERKQFFPSTIGIVSILFMLIIIGYQLMEDPNRPEPSQNSSLEEWHVEWTAKDLPIEVDLPSTLQIIVMDEANKWVKNAKVKTVIQNNSQVEELQFVPVEDGLYEARVLFSSPGLWRGTLTVQQGEDTINQPIEITVK
ncbi:hypothetical protein J2S74_004717 [Evansella vedderi]|uniref:YtkA-like domain-containing protein n=1 Tax=Evansella vedderi TaxID=38282 RepID=A0ABU0A2C5_9BACI|nr:hypothetical protein [Evansella vedderi]MDQ0257259.1 hypothetical protein [Evansella vedderi]